MRRKSEEVLKEISEIREDDLKEVLFGIEETFEILGRVEKGLKSLRTRLRKCLVDGQAMATLEEFEKKFFKNATKITKDTSHFLGDLEDKMIELDWKMKYNS